VAARSQLEAAARPLGQQVFSIQRFSGENYLAAAKSFHYLETSQQDNMELILIQTISLITTTSFREELRGYMFSRYVKDDARLRYSYLYKNIKILIDPAHITRLTPGQAKHLLNGIATLRDYLRLIGYKRTADAIDDYLKQLRKIAPKPQKVRVLDYEVDTSIIDKGLKEIKQIKNGKLWKILALISFFTGLRGTEIVFLWNNWRRLRKIYHNGIVIIELGYNRKSKKAWITMLPEKLANIIMKNSSSTTITYNAIDNLRDKAGVHVGLMRKVHLAILSKTMMEHEIKLLQGRVSEITVRHYTRHLRVIADKYREAYKEYFTLLEEL